jgi:hypothetical protein
VAGAGCEFGRGHIAFTTVVTYWYGDRRFRDGTAVAANWRQSAVDVSLGVTFR